MNNLLSYCGLVDARQSASEKDLPVEPWSDFFYYSVNMLPETKMAILQTLFVVCKAKCLFVLSRQGK